MREIKIRGYAVEEMVNSQWIYGTGVRTTKFAKEFAEEIGKSGEAFVFYESGGWIEVYPESVGQYTGLKDKNDTEIYEFDKVSIFSNRVKGFVKFQNAMFDVIEEGSNTSYLAEHKDDIIVIGSTYKNCDLLEQTK